MPISLIDNSFGEIMEENSYNLVDIFFNLSIYGQITILTLIIVSVITSYSFIRILIKIRFEKVRHKHFEDLFWSGTDMSEIYSDLIKKEWDPLGISEKIFIGVMKEFIKIKDLGKADITANLLDEKSSLIKVRFIDELYESAGSIFNYISYAILITLVYFLYLFYNLLFLGQSEHLTNFELFHSSLPSLIGFTICLLSVLTLSAVQYKLKALEFQVILQVDELSFLIKKHMMG